MEAADHVILCGGLANPRGMREKQLLRLDLGSDDPNVDLEIVDISCRPSAEVPEILTDLVEIASYVYCADHAITRGGEGVLAYGSAWRRNLTFHIPVRLPAVWSNKETAETLQKTLSLLSDDTYKFHFSRMESPVPMQRYLKFDEPRTDGQEAMIDKRRVALVSHRSNSKISNRQKKLVAELRGRCSPPPLHVPVWVHQRGIRGREYTQRARTFLYASLAVAVARVFGLKRVRFYENGVVGLNLPISEQVVGARATRTTHPQALSGFSDLFSLRTEERFSIENPFLWLTKTNVIDLIGDSGNGDLIQYSISCMHTQEQTVNQPHCGRCSQCVSRRFAALASRYAEYDPTGSYRVDLLTGERFPEKDQTLIESFIRFATEVGSLDEVQITAHYGEIGRMLRHLRPLSSDQVGERIVQLYRSHSGDVRRVIDQAIGNYATEIREGRLPKNCAIILAVARCYRTDQQGNSQCVEQKVEGRAPSEGHPEDKGQFRERQHKNGSKGRRPESTAGGADAKIAKRARARTVATLIGELNVLKPQMFEDEREYKRLREQYPDYLIFKIAENRPDLKQKIIAFQGSSRHIRLAQELTAAEHGRELSTIKDDWKDFKPAEFKRRH